MSSTPDGGASPASSVFAASVTRRVPPPCWTDDETLALVNAYKEKWFALRRGNLRAADWEVVAATVSSAGGGTKSSIQCRHKIEKLRKRYRAEKQRCLNRPGKFSSSWELFPLLDSMGFAPIPTVRSSDPDMEPDVFMQNFDGDTDSNLDFGLGLGIQAANRFRKKGYVKTYGDFSTNFDLDQDFEVGFGLKRKYRGNSKSNVDFRGNSVCGFGIREEGEVVLVPKATRLKTPDKPSVADFGQGTGRFPVVTIDDRCLVPPRFKAKSSGKADINFSPNLDFDDDMASGGGRFGTKVLVDWDSMPIGLRANVNHGTSESYIQKADFRAANGFRSSLRLEYEKSNENTSRGQSDLIEQVVSSVKMLTEMFVRVENTKMEMVREIEKARMEMELKQCQMMLDLQQQIVDAFAAALIEKKKNNKEGKSGSPNRDKQRL